jgi:4-hydroxy-tetrahydrodipicolinate reductase
MAINVLINGAFGRMGQTTVKAIENDPRFNLVGQTGREYDLKKSIQDSKAEIVIDFTGPHAVYDNANVIIDCNVHPVIGSSGLTLNDVKKLQARCEKMKLGGIIAPNFSIGAVLMIKYAQEIIKYMPRVEIIELHHENKADSPSGTAIRTAETLAASLDNKIPAPKSSKETVKGARGATHCQIPIHSVRLPGILAREEIIFGEPGETLTLRHDSIDRECFMPGLLLACEKVMTLDHLVYGLEEIL